MTTKQNTQGSPFLFDQTTGKIVGVKHPDGTESSFLFTLPAISIASLSDVEIDDPQEGDVLTFTDGKWKNVAAEVVEEE